MGSKQLKSILSGVPSATIEGQKILAKEVANGLISPNSDKCDSKLVARVPQRFKDELREYVRNHKGVTEQTLILKGLQSIGFNVPSNWLVDKRSNR